MKTAVSLVITWLILSPLPELGFAQEPADFILQNGHIITVDPENTIAQAMAVRDGRLVAVGTNETVEAFRGPETEIKDAGGKTILPGLIDSHTHPLGAAMIEFDHEIPDMLSIADVLQYIKARAETLGDGDWIVIQQVFITRLEEKRYPTREELDSAAPRNPVVFRTGPDASLNSLALERLEVTKDDEVPAGSKIERDAEGKLTGILRGWSQLIDIPRTGSKSPAEQDRRERLKLLFADYNTVGITGIIDRNTSSQGMGLYEDLLSMDELTLRLAMSRAVSNKGGADDIRRRIAAIAEEPRTKNPHPLLRTVGIKMFLDGGMLTGSALMRQPWGTSETYGIIDPDYRGLRFIDEATLVSAVEACVEHDLQFTAHSVGDGAVHALLEAYETVAARRPMTHTRPNITHCNFMSSEAIDKMASLGVSADVQPAWLYLDTRTLTSHFGEERLTYFQPLKTMFERGVLAGGGSDHMQKIGPLRAINPYHPFLGMWVTMTRQARGYEGRLHPEQALDRLQALRLYTINNAYLMFLEKEIGSLETGKRADFILLDRNYLTCSINEIRRIEVLETWLEGGQVYPSK